MLWRFRQDDSLAFMESDKSRLVHIRICMYVYIYIYVFTDMYMYTEYTTCIFHCFLQDELLKARCRLL